MPTTIPFSLREKMSEGQMRGQSPTHRHTPSIVILEPKVRESSYFPLPQRNKKPISTPSLLSKGEDIRRTDEGNPRPTNEPKRTTISTFYKSVILRSALVAGSRL